MNEPSISDAERRQLVAEAGTADGLDRALARLHAALRDAKADLPGVQGSFRRLLTSLDDGLEPDDPVARLVDRYRRGVADRTELLADPDVAERLRARLRGGAAGGAGSPPA